MLHSNLLDSVKIYKLKNNISLRKNIGIKTVSIVLEHPEIVIIIMFGRKKNFNFFQV